MRLKIDLNGIMLRLKIMGYTPSTQEDWDSQWCDVDFSFSSGNWLDYHRENDEVLLSCEVEALAENIEKLLNDELNEITEISCIEPDFNFILHPKRDLREDPKYTYIREGYEIADIYMEWTVTFWNEGLTDNYLSVTLDREDMKILLVYLNYVVGKYATDSQEVEDLIRRDFLTD